MKYIFLLLLFTSCGSTWVVQGVTVHAPTRVVPKPEGYILGAAAVAGYVAADHLTTPK